MKRKAMGQKGSLLQKCACLLAPLFCCSFFGADAYAYAQTNEEKSPLSVYVLLGEDGVGNSSVSELSAEQSSAYETGFDGVYYYGKAEENQSVRPEKTNILGHGASLQKFGVEVGFAEELSKLGEKCLIFKYAVADTGLNEYTSNGFLEAFSNAVESYQELNYKVQVKGSVYLGENEDEDVSLVIQEIRREYAALGVEEEISPFLIAGLAQDSEAVRTLPFVYPIEYEDSTSADETILFGHTVATSLLDRAQENSVRVVTGENGQADVEYAVFEQDSMLITFTGDYGYYLSSLIINGEEVLPPQNGELRLNKGRYFIQAQFSEKEKFVLTVENEFAKGVVQIQNEKQEYYVGDIVRFCVTAAKGYLVEKVLFNGQKIEQVDGEYSVEITGEENVISIVYMQAEVAKKEGSSKKTGCSGGVEALSPLALLLFFVILKKKKY